MSETLTVITTSSLFGVKPACCAYARVRHGLPGRRIARTPGRMCMVIFGTSSHSVDATFRPVEVVVNGVPGCAW